jgi:hypothetical protein
VTINATTEAAANDVVALPARVYDGSMIIVIEYFIAAIVTGASSAVSGLYVNLWDGAVDLGRIAFVETAAANAIVAPGFGKRRLTPSAASHTYSIKASRTDSNGLIAAAPPYIPCYIRAVVVAA